MFQPIGDLTKGSISDKSAAYKGFQPFLVTFFLPQHELKHIGFVFSNHNYFLERRDTTNEMFGPQPPFKQ